MRAGKLRHHITISEIASDRNPLGENVENLVNILNCRAEILAVRCDETYNNQIQNKQAIEFRIRYNKSIDPLSTDWVIFYKNQKYEIISAVNVYEQDKQFNITAVLY